MSIVVFNQQIVESHTIGLVFNVTERFLFEKLVPHQEIHRAMNNLAAIKAFELELDEELARRPSLQFNAAATRLLALNCLDLVYERNKEAAWFRKGLSILLPHFGKSNDPGEPSIETLIDDVLFASNYYSVREALYYTYNAQDSFTWTLTDKNVLIEFNDRTIPQQFYHTANGSYLGSLGIFRDFGKARRIEELIRSEKFIDGAAASQELGDLISEEIERKLTGYYTLLEEDAEVSLGRYTYREFLLTYKHLIGNALIQRYKGRVEGKSGAVTMDRRILVPMLANNSGLNESTCAAVLDDICYPESVGRRTADPIYYALYELPNQRIAMVPSDFLVHEGIVNCLRLAAARDPNHFLANVSGPLGNALTRKVQRAFEEHGFICKPEMSLGQIGTGLPDIDLMVISEEKTLGYFVYLCEIKNPLPPTWAKDQLRVLAKDSVAKAFRQLDTVAEALGSPAGIEFVKTLFPRDSMPHLKEGFLVVIRTLIVTSQNTGMFFGDKNHAVVDYRTLQRILDAADGDVTYINHILANMGSLAEAGMEIVSSEFRVGGRDVRHEGVKIRALTSFAKNEYKSAGIDVAHFEQFVKDGASPFNWHLQDPPQAK